MGSLNASLTQLEEYFPYMEEVIGSSPIGCTNKCLSAGVGESGRSVKPLLYS